jgi:hypothetical protein
VNDMLGTLVICAFLVIAAAMRRAQLHRTRANERFLATYRAGLQPRRTPANRTIQAFPPPAPPMVRHRAPAGATRPPTRVASAGSTVEDGQ